MASRTHSAQSPDPKSAQPPTEKSASASLLELLATPDKTMSSIGLSHAIENTSYLEFEYVTVRGELGAICNRTNTIHITALGIKAIEDWEHQHHKDRTALWENRFWKLAPIIISFTALLKSFWPELTNLWQVLQSTLCTR